MPRPVDESRFRRFLMQGIMWIILGATIAAAALVDRVKAISHAVVLDSPKKFDGLSIRLPRGWREIDDPDEQVLATLQDPSSGDVLTVTLHKPSLLDVLSRPAAGRRATTRPGQQQVIIDGQKVNIVIRSLRSTEDDSRFTELRVTRALEGGQTLSISLMTPSTGSSDGGGPLTDEIDLLKQVASSVKINQP